VTDWIVGGNADARQAFAREKGIVNPLYIHAECDVRGRTLREGDRIFWLWPPPDERVAYALSVLATYAGKPLSHFDAYKLRG